MPAENAAEATLAEGLTVYPCPKCAGCGAAPVRRNAPDPGTPSGTTRTASRCRTSPT